MSHLMQVTRKSTSSCLSVSMGIWPALVVVYQEHTSPFASAILATFPTSWMCTLR